MEVKLKMIEGAIDAVFAGSSTFQTVVEVVAVYGAYKAYQTKN